MPSRSFCTMGMFVLLGLGGCRREISEDPPLAPIRNMWIQPKYKAQSKSPFFPDHRTMRTPVEGTVDRTQSDNVAASTGRLENGSGYVLEVPQSVQDSFGGMEPMLQRGQERYNIYCSVCHDRTGGGQGLVVQRGFMRPPSLVEPRLRHMPDGQMFVTLTNGVRNMPAYASQISPTDRWAVVAYVRALQLQGTRQEAASPSTQRNTP